MKLLIIGGTGFVGQNIAEILEERHDVQIGSRKSGLDLTEQASIGRVLGGLTARGLAPDVIINCAAEVGSLNYVTESAAEVIDTNARMILNLYKVLAETRSCAAVINPVANCAYPGSLVFHSEEEFWNGPVHDSVLSYGTTRRLMVTVSDCYRRQFGIRSINYFVPNMYGEYDSADPNKAHALNALASKLIKAREQGTPELVVWGTGKPVREWLYAKDFARALLYTIDRLDEDFSEDINVGQKSGISISALMQYLVPMTGYEGKIVYDTSKQDGAPEKVMDNLRFRDRFPDFEFTEFEVGIGKTIDYYQSLYPY